MNPSKFLLYLIILCYYSPMPGYPADLFHRAEPVWPAGLEREMNVTVGFRTVFRAPADDTVSLAIAGSSLYRVYLDGRFVLQGPARAAHGFYRVDEADLAPWLDPAVEQHVLAVEIVGYNANSYYLLDVPSFLQAELTAGGSVLAATGAPGGFEAGLIDERTRRVERYSFQRTFIEHWRLAPGWSRWRSDPAIKIEPVELTVQPDKRAIAREVPYPEFSTVAPHQLLSSGRLRKVEVENPWISRGMRSVGPDFDGWPRDSLEVAVSLVLQEYETVSGRDLSAPWRLSDSLSLDALEYGILDLGTNLSGMVGFTVDVREESRLAVTFDEVLTDGDVDWTRLGVVNAVTLELAPGRYRFESFEPYTMRYLKFNLLSGSLKVVAPYLRELAHPFAGRARFACSDPRLERLFEAGRQTFRQNSTDILMDCPHRERAGWLCDSYFTARAARDLTGSSVLERCFLENFIMPDSFPTLPEGMLPMCYPADHVNGRFIPNWAMWYVLQLEEYYRRTGDRALVDSARERVLALFDYFDGFLNDDGLLESLESWVFIEWSRANDFVQDVNYPSNMLYSAALAAAGRMYEDRKLTSAAERVRTTVGRLAFDGEFFVDNAERNLFGLKNTGNHTEVCQYFAFYFGIADSTSHPELWRRLIEDFGPRRDPKRTWPEVHPAAPFIGKMLRMDVLGGAGLADRLLDEMVGYYLPMAERTGTLWEFDGAAASCNHGFAGHICTIIFRDVLGLAEVDQVVRELTVRFNRVPLASCSGVRPVADGEIELAWRVDGGRLRYRLSAPDGWAVRIENASGLELVEE